MEDWESLGGHLASAPTVASWGRDELQVFVLFPDGELWSRYWDGSAWHDWESLGGSFVGQPAAAARDADRIDVLAAGPDGKLWHRWWDGIRWVSWERVEGAPAGVVAVDCTWVEGRLDVFVQGAGDELWHASLETG